MLAHACGRYERFMRSRKERLFAGLRGTVLEIGPGIGANLPLLPTDIHYIAADPNVYTHARLRTAARERGIPMDLRPQRVEELAIADGSLDAVVSTLVLCSVADQARVVREVLRMLRPGGRLVFIEHIGAPRGTWLRAVQQAVRPVWRVLGDGCEPDRDTGRTLERAGFGSLDIECFRAPVPVVSPHIAGVAVKKDEQA